MLSTRRWPGQARVARRNAAVSSSGASRPTRSAADSSSSLQPSSGPIRVSTPALLIRRGVPSGAVSDAASQHCRRAATGDRLGQVGAPLLDRLAPALRASSASALS